MADIFMSYASEDRERARVLAEALESRGWTVWWDREIPIGKAYTDVIEHELMSAGCVMVLWSEESVKSQWVCNEAREGLSRHVLVPVLIDDVRLPLEFRHLQTASLVEWEPDGDSPELAKVESAIRTFSRKEGAAAPAPAPPADRTPAGPRRSNRTMFIVLGVAAALIAALVVGWSMFSPADTTGTTTATVTEPATSAPATVTETVTETTETTDTTPATTTTTAPDVPPPSRELPGVAKFMSGRVATCRAVLLSRTRALTVSRCVGREGLVLQLGDTSIRYRVIEQGQNTDSLALLSIGVPASLEVTPMRFSQRRAREGEVVTFGSTLESTRVVSVSDDGILYDLDVPSGSMGTPIVASRNTVIGVHWAKHARGSPLQRAIPLSAMPQSMIDNLR